MRILVTGGAGFIGSHLVDKLLRQGHRVAVIDNLTAGQKINVNKKAEFTKIDIRSLKIKNIVGKFSPEIVYHLAAQVSVPESIINPVKNAQVNIIGSLNLIHSCLLSHIRKFIFFSSGGAMYGDADLLPTPELADSRPLSPYGQAKLTIENYLAGFNATAGLRYVGLRLANVYGPRQKGAKESGVITIFIKNMLAGKPLSIYGRGDQTRDFIFVDDVVSAAMAAMEKGVGLFNVGTSIETSIRRLVVLLGEVSGTVPQVIYQAARGVYDVERSALDYQKIAKELRWQPRVDLKTGLSETINWFKDI